jgi:GR25 family glycosyltransferase involved in LPS biosynthesis
MNKILNLAEKTFIINLKHRTDRVEHVKNELSKINHNNYEFFEAYGINSEIPQRYIDRIGVKDFKMSGWYGNKISHYAVIELAKQQKLKSVLILEDDVYFLPEFNSICNIAYEQLNDINWDIIHFGGNHRFFGSCETEYPRVSDGLVPFRPNLSRIMRMFCLHAYLVKDTIYDFVLNNTLQSHRSIDNYYAYEVYRRFNSFCIRPAIAKQIKGMNNIGEVFCDYDQYID